MAVEEWDAFDAHPPTALCIGRERGCLPPVRSRPLSCSPGRDTARGTGGAHTLPLGYHLGYRPAVSPQRRTNSSAIVRRAVQYRVRAVIIRATGSGRVGT